MNKLKTVGSRLKVALFLLAVLFTAQLVGAQTNDPSVLYTGVTSNFNSAFGVFLAIAGVMFVVGAIFMGLRGKKKVG